MTYATERENFLLTMHAEGMAADVARLILRHAQTIQRCAELECSSEAADKDRVACPGGTGGACLCEHWSGCGCPDIDNPTSHHKVTRVARTSARSEARITALCAASSNGRVFVPVFHGDPRGACVKLQVPSGTTDDWGREGICVPTRN